MWPDTACDDNNSHSLWFKKMSNHSTKSMIASWSHGLDKGIWVTLWNVQWYKVATYKYILSFDVFNGKVSKKTVGGK